MRLEELQDVAFAVEEIAEVRGVFVVISPRDDAPSIYVQIAHEARSLTISRAHYAIRRQSGRSETAGIVFVEELPPRLGAQRVLLNETARIAARGRASARKGKAEMANALFPERPGRAREGLVLDLHEVLVVGPRDLVARVSTVYEAPPSGDRRALRRRCAGEAADVSSRRARRERGARRRRGQAPRDPRLVRAPPVARARPVPRASLERATRVLATTDRPWQVVAETVPNCVFEDRLRSALSGRPEQVRVLLVDRDPDTKSISAPPGANIVLLRVEHTDDALWLLREAPFALVLCDATLVEGTTFAYRTLWEQEPSTKSKTFLVAPRVSVDALPPSRDPSRPRRVLARPVTREAVMALLAEIANGQYNV